VRKPKWSSIPEERRAEIEAENRRAVANLAGDWALLLAGQLTYLPNQRTDRQRANVRHDEALKRHPIALREYVRGLTDRDLLRAVMDMMDPIPFAEDVLMVTRDTLANWFRNRAMPWRTRYWCERTLAKRLHR